MDARLGTFITPRHRAEEDDTPMPLRGRQHTGSNGLTMAVEFG